LKKINEIEEQMAQQWWKTRHDAPRTEPPPQHLIDPRRVAQSGAADQARLRPTQQVPSASRTMPRPVSDTSMERTQQLPRMGVPLQQGTVPPQHGHPVVPVKPTAEPSSTEKLSSGLRQPQLSKPTSSPISNSQGALSALHPSSASSGAITHGISSSSIQATDTGDGTSALFTASKFYALDVQELALDPEIEEASIRFASGDDNAAEQGLLDILKRDGGGTVDEWLTLFDLYRAIGNADAFESLAIDFANRFSTSAPQWFSMKADLAARTGAIAKQATSSLGKATWVADKVLEPYAATVLAKLLERTPQPWVLDWTHLHRIESGSLPALIQLFKAWVVTPVDLRFVSAATLRECLERITVSGDSTVDRAWWELRLLVLRVMNMGSDFEPVAIDYCVTYELSPPSWEPPVCRFRSLHIGETATVTTAEKQPMFVESQLHDSFLPSDSETSGFSTSQLSLDWPTAYLEGEIYDDAQTALAAIDQQLGSPPVLIVSCKYLIRVDFSSAGNILNWAAAHQRDGRQVRFVDVHRLIAAFFHVVGVTESAKIVTRTD
jgi:anti-anti-sigma regulatory factor